MCHFKCSECGKFIGYNDYNAVVYTPYGGPEALEPPNEIYVCGECWNKATDAEKALTISTAWLKPCQLFKKGG